MQLSIILMSMLKCASFVTMVFICVVSFLSNTSKMLAVGMRPNEESSSRKQLVRWSVFFFKSICTCQCCLPSAASLILLLLKRQNVIHPAVYQNQKMETSGSGKRKCAGGSKACETLQPSGRLFAMKPLEGLWEQMSKQNQMPQNKCHPTY